MEHILVMSHSFLLLLLSVGQGVHVPERPTKNNKLGYLNNYLRELKIVLLVLNFSRLVFRSLLLSRHVFRFGRSWELLL